MATMGEKILSHGLWDTVLWQPGGKGGEQAAGLQGNTLSSARGYSSTQCHTGVLQSCALVS